MMSCLQATYTVVLLFGLSAAVTHAGPVTVDQIWENKLLFAAGIDENNILEVSARLDAGDVPANGIFDVLLDDYTVLHKINGIGQSFSRVVFPDSRGLTQAGDMFARFSDGEFSSIGIVGSASGIAQATIRDLASGVSVGIRLGFDAPTGRAELIRLFSGSGSDNFLLLSTDLSGQIGEVPGPLPLHLLMLAALCLLTRYRFASNCKRAGCTR